MNIEVRAVPGDKLYLLAAGGRIDEVKVNALYINPHGSVWMHCVKKGRKGRNKTVISRIGHRQKAI